MYEIKFVVEWPEFIENLSGKISTDFQKQISDQLSNSKLYSIRKFVSGFNGKSIQSISKDINVVYIELEPGMGDKVREQWQRWWPDIPLVVKPSPFRSRKRFVFTFRI